MNVTDLIEKAGGVIGLAERLRVARTTVLDWRRINKIPGSRVAQIGKELGVEAEQLLPLVQEPRNSTSRNAA